MSDVPENDKGEIPARIDELITEFGIYVPSDAEGEMLQIYENMQNGRCATCEATVGEEAWVVLQKPKALADPVVIMIFCGGACATDMQVMGFLGQTYDDIKQQVEFRGGQGGN